MDAEKRARFKENILACERIFHFFIEYLIDYQVSLQCLQSDSKNQVKRNQIHSTQKPNVKAESYNKAIQKKPFYKNSTVTSFVAHTNFRSKTRGNSSSGLNSTSNLSSPIKNNSFNNQGNATNRNGNVRTTVLCPMRHKECQHRSLARLNQYIE